MFTLSNITTYQAGIYQARAFRRLRLVKNRILKKHGLTVMQWAVLGLVYDAGEAGVRTSDLAKILDTTQAYITGVVNSLEVKEFISRRLSEKDSRTRLVVFIPKYKQMVEEIEASVRQQLREEVYQKVSAEELRTYVKVLAVFAED